MKLREALKWLNDALRPVQVPRKDGEADNVDALAGVAAEHREGAMFGGGAVAFPPNYVPSQQDERPQ
ncbi:MAG TPA: hypothetical protein VKR23_08710 [Gaiellaceae bacterium]|nr:hypothetical protein [Gaiellaceae bacterium]